MKKILLVTALFFSLGLLLVGDNPRKDGDRLVQVVEKVMPAVVEIHVDATVEKDGKVFSGTVLGSGVFISENGYVLTAAHLFKDFTVKGISITSPNGDTVEGKLVMVSKTADLAVVKAGFYSKTPKVTIADPRTLRVAQEVFAIGSPLGLSFSVTSGIVSALYRDFDHAYNVTQSDTSINPGNSGGPLFNLQGELVGINVFMISDNPFATFTGLGFSEQCGEIRKFLTDVKKVAKDLVL